MQPTKSVFLNGEQKMNFTENKKISKDIETAVLFASYESRCLRVAKQLAESEFDGEVLIFYCDDIKSGLVYENLIQFDKVLGGKCKKIPISFVNPEPVITAARKIGSRNSLLIDVTCFNRENLFPFLWASRIGIDVCPSLQFAYTAPQKYGSWLSRDYHMAHNLLGFGGGFISGGNRNLMCLVGYEANRALAVIETAEPSSVILALGSIPTRSEFDKRNRTSVLEVLGSNNFRIEQINVTDPQICLNDLSRILKAQHPAASFHIAPFNTKLSCVAVYALWLKNPSIRIWNALPERYNVRGYSKGDTDPRYFNVVWTESDTRRIKL